LAVRIDDPFPVLLHLRGMITIGPYWREHWVPDLERWFDRGVDTPGLVLIKVQAARITYWDGNEEGEVSL
jgi:general stress protein 26